MKKTFPLLLVILLMIAGCSNEEKIELFNGTNLDNWKLFVPDSDDPSSVFSVADEKIIVSGIPNGYMRTKESFSSYDLHVEWRWTDEPVNSGVLLHVTGEELIWPNCIEAQLQAGNAGDFVLIGKGVGISINNSAHVIESEENRYAVLAKMNASSENEPGEWNTYEISVRESEITLEVNGVVQNIGTNPTKTGGNICIQSEGAPMEFRNIYLIPKE
ncbi:DUF1080 domain-containing protein [Bacteroidota bacterium]